jgi:hypothetical protein
MAEPPPLDYRALVVAKVPPGTWQERLAGRCLWAALVPSVAAMALCYGAKTGSMRPAIGVGLLWLTWLTCLNVLVLSVWALVASGFPRGWKPLLRLVGVLIVSIVAALWCVGTAVAANSQ